MKMSSSKFVLIIASIVLLIALCAGSAVAVSALSDKSDSGCAGVPQGHPVASGHVPEGGKWSVSANVKANGSCARWLFGVNFAPFGTGPGSWSGAWDIPAGGHLSDQFLISAQDEANSSIRAFSGIVGAHVKAIGLRFQQGGPMVVVHPRLPNRGDRRRFPWLRGFRFFVRFLPKPNRIRVARLLDGDGDVIFIARPRESIFEGPM